MFVKTLTLLFASFQAENQIVQPAELAARLADSAKTKPLLLHVGFPVLYRSVHITGSKFAGPGSKPEGIDDLKKLVSSEPHGREIVIYCGCCPWEKCPNVRPAFQALRELGFTNVHALEIPTNLAKDWIDHSYPTEKRAASTP